MRRFVAGVVVGAVAAYYGFWGWLTWEFLHGKRDVTGT